MALWPIILANKSFRHNGIPERTLRHERIHHKQQLEMLILPFYVWYLLEWLLRCIIYRDRKKAYRQISLEKEAYMNDGCGNYLNKRKCWDFLKYI